MAKTKWCVIQKTKSEFAVKINTGCSGPLKNAEHKSLYITLCQEGCLRGMCVD